MYIQHRKEAKASKKKDAEHTDDSVFKDVVLSPTTKEARYGAPVLNGYSNGVDNMAFELEKTQT